MYLHTKFDQVVFMLAQAIFFIHQHNMIVPTRLAQQASLESTI